MNLRNAVHLLYLLNVTSKDILVTKAVGFSVERLHVNHKLLKPILPLSLLKEK